MVLALEKYTVQWELQDMGINNQARYKMKEERENIGAGTKNGFMEKVTKMIECPPNSTSFKIPNYVHMCVCWRKGINRFG